MRQVITIPNIPIRTPEVAMIYFERVLVPNFFTVLDLPEYVQTDDTFNLPAGM